MICWKDVLRPIYYQIPQKIRLGQQFHQFYNTYSQMQRVSYSCRRAYQLEKLKWLIDYAYVHTKYYHQLFDENGIRPEEIQTFKDMERIPYLTKDLVREHREDMVADCVPKRKLIYVTTGGSTGLPLGFYISKTVDRRRLAFEWINWNHMGYHMGDKCAVLRGPVVSDGWYMYDHSQNLLVLSTYKMTNDLLPQYIRKLEEYQPVIIQGYPSALEILAKFILSTQHSIRICLRAISTSSEVLYPNQKKVIEKAFGCKVWDKYGNCEQVGVIGMCKTGVYHEFMEHSYLEFLPMEDFNGLCEIVGTSFINDAMPFIRYRTGDCVAVSESHMCSCGAESGIISHIEGRHGDFVQTKQYNLISITALNTHSDIFDHVQRIQYYQDTIGVVVLKIVRDQNYTDDDTRRIKAELETKFQKQVDLQIKFVDEISLTKRGKYKYLDQRLTFY